jgi:recombination protein RecA
LANNIDSVLKDIAKQFGEGTVEILSDTNDYAVERISSGSLNLDMALGGGFPLGRTLELYGPESGGKTTVALLHAAEVQKRYPDRYVLFLDLEGTFDKSLAMDYGVNDKTFLVSQPTSGEEAFNIAESFIRSGTVSLVILDSVSALLPEAEDKAAMEQQSIGLQARLMSKALRKITPICSHQNCTFLFVNQIREKVGVMYGNPEVTSGGRGLPFYASIRIHIRAGEKIPDPANKDETMGHVVNVRVVKNKTARPFKVASFPLFYGIGVDKMAEVIDIAVLANIIDKGGAWFRIKDEEGKPLVRKWCKPNNAEYCETTLNFQGKDKFVQHVHEDVELFELLKKAVYGDTVTLEEYAGGAVNEITSN